MLVGVPNLAVCKYFFFCNSIFMDLLYYLFTVQTQSKDIVVFIINNYDSLHKYDNCIGELYNTLLSVFLTYHQHISINNN